MVKSVFIYGLRDPRDGQIKYVGKTKDLKQRMKDHLKDAKRRNTPKNAWLLKLQRLGLRPEMIVLEEVPRDKWVEAERRWIAQMREQSPALKNICDGGEGRTGPLSEETKRKLSLAGRGRKWTLEQRMKASQAKIGHTLSAESREKIGRANRGRKHTKQACEKLSRALRGVPKGAEHRRKIGLAHKGRVFSETTKQKMRLARKDWEPPKWLTEIQRVKCRGEGNGRAKLTVDSVREIRERYGAGGITLQELALDYPVTFSTIHRIVTRQSWKHV